jgi:hypothetical protein
VEPALTEADGVVNDGGVDPGVSTSNCNALDVPPPGAGVCTVTGEIPALTMLAAGTCAVKLVPLTYCVVSAVGPQYNVEPETNPDPVAVSLKVPLPALINAGDKLERTGAGFADGMLIV